MLQWYLKSMLFSSLLLASDSEGSWHRFVLNTCSLSTPWYSTWIFEDSDYLIIVFLLVYQRLSHRPSCRIRPSWSWSSTSASKKSSPAAPAPSRCTAPARTRPTAHSTPSRSARATPWPLRLPTRSSWTPRPPTSWPLTSCSSSRGSWTTGGTRPARTSWQPWPWRTSTLPTTRSRTRPSTTSTGPACCPTRSASRSWPTWSRYWSRTSSAPRCSRTFCGAAPWLRPAWQLPPTRALPPLCPLLPSSGRPTPSTTPTFTCRPRLSRTTLGTTTRDTSTTTTTPANAGAHVIIKKQRGSKIRALIGYVCPILHNFPIDCWQYHILQIWI